MPTTQVQTHLEARKKEIATLLHNGHEVTLKDLGWLLYGMNDDMEELAGLAKSNVLCVDALTKRLEELATKPPSRLATVAQESIVKWAVPFGMGFLFWLLIQFANSGFKVP
jgi:phosphohistidine phosphatase SixA